MLKLAISAFLALADVSTNAAQNAGKNPVSVEIVATASEYVSRSTNVSHAGHSFTNCSGNTSFFGQFHDYGDFGTFSGTADTRTRCSTTLSPPADSTVTSYRRLNYTIAKSDTALYLLSCTQIWKHTAKERALLGVMGGLEGSNGSSSENRDKVAANAKGEWSDCPAFVVGSKYTLTVRKTSDARLDDGTGRKPAKLDYLSSAAIPASASQQEPEAAPSAALEAKVHVTSDPTGGEIYIDGKFFGNAPSDLKLPPGEHLFKVVIGGKEWSRIVQITAGEITIHADLGADSTVVPPPPTK